MISENKVYVGVMSGSSLDGIDIALITFFCDPSTNKVHNWNIDAFETVHYDDSWKDLLRGYSKKHLESYFGLEADYSKYLAETIADFLNRHNISASDVDAIGSHGHTLIHFPSRNISVQIGDPAVIAAISGIPTVGNFRIQDVVKGGKGAPIVPIVEKDLFPDHDYFLNLGGIANVTMVADKVAYDVCPLNQVLNHFARKTGAEFDRDGNIARRGMVDEHTLATLSSMDYYNTPPPKSLDNNWIKGVFIPLLNDLSVEDATATATEFMAFQIAQQFKKPGRLLVSGGGTYNIYLMERIKHHLLDGIDLVIPEDMVVEAKESLLMAYMAHLRMNKSHNVLRDFTGAASDSIAGGIYL